MTSDAAPPVSRAPAAEDPGQELDLARRRLAEDRSSGCAGPLDITFWESEIIRIEAAIDSLEAPHGN